jgi:hypothetical protein
MAWNVDAAGVLIRTVTGVELDARRANAAGELASAVVIFIVRNAAPVSRPRMILCATPMGVPKGADVTASQLRPGLDLERAADRDVQQRQFGEWDRRRL